MIRKFSLFFTMGTILLLLAGQSYAKSFEYGFYGITNNDDTDTQIGEAQLSMVVSGETGGTEVRFDFYNSGPEESSITDIYFDDDIPVLQELLGIYDHDADNQDPDVSFSINASPPNLPGGNNILPNFVASAGLSADSDTPTQPMGVNPGETLGITFALALNQSFENVIESLDNTNLRVGLHVQGFASEGSESFINTGNGNPVPEPATYLLFGSGLIGLAYLRKRTQKRRSHDPRQSREGAYPG